MNLRPWQYWAGFAMSLLMVLLGVTWISATTLDLDRAQVEARRKATLEENVRLALWRMDSAIAPIVAAESARPYFAYRSFFDPSRGYEEMFDPMLAHEGLTPSPLLIGRPEEVQVHFQLDPSGGLTSPQVPEGGLKQLAAGRVDDASITQATSRLNALRPRVTQARLGQAVEPGAGWIDKNDFEIAQRKGGEAQQKAESEVPSFAQAVKNTAEFVSRSKVARQASSYSGYNDNLRATYDKAPAAPAFKNVDTDGGVIAEGSMTPVWVDGELLLVRKAVVRNRTYLQGAWLDWARVQSKLTAEIQDLLPNAKLMPVGAGDRGSEARQLAALPVRLDPGDLDLPPIEPSLTVVIILGVAWSGFLVAALAVGLLLLGATSLSERRADFVSAVTHELRTPLTTFRMYSEMLADGMVTDPAKQASYLDTLRRESVRLSHLVENVLSFARIERGRDDKKHERFSVRDTIRRFEDRLVDRATQAGMTLEIVEMTDSLDVEADSGAVEQVLYNLVDNACKYACNTEDKRIHVEATTRGRTVVVKVRDHGPGISKDDQRRLFSPFSKSAQRAAISAPGVGLGLALSRRLARSMGGNLSLASNRDGAAFALTLRRAG